jgi:hypothetical protein
VQNQRIQNFQFTLSGKQKSFQNNNRFLNKKGVNHVGEQSDSN